MKPNIILICIDDLGWRDLGCYGSTFYETPNLDKLVSESVVFSNAYATSPVCSPSRASILTGKYPVRIGITNYIGAQEERGKVIGATNSDYLPLSECSLAKALKEGGYNTYHVGKWHLGSEDYWPLHHGFDINIGGCDYGRPVHGYFSPYYIPTLPDGPEGEYLTDRLTDEAIKLIKDNKDNPFFLNLWHYTVHTPLQAKQEDIDYFTRKRKVLNLDEQEEFIECGYYPVDHMKHLVLKKRIIQGDPIYAAMIYNLDWNIGRLIDALKETGQYDNTLIIFTSDNGGLVSEKVCPTSNMPLRDGKGWMYEGGLRVPLFFKLPKPNGNLKMCHTPVILTDLYPTILEVAALPLRPYQHCDGVSIVPLFTDIPIERDALFFHYPHYGNQGGTPFSAIRVNNYKLIHFYEDNHQELYNLAKDISENDNIINKEVIIAKDLANRLNEWIKETKAQMPHPLQP